VKLFWLRPRVAIPGLAFQEIFEVAVVVERSGLLHVFEDLEHVLPAFAVRFFELHGDTGARVNSCNRPFGSQAAVFHGETQLDFGARGKNSAGFDIAATHADVRQASEHRSPSGFGLQLNRDPALEPRLRAAVLVGELLLFFHVHAAVASARSSSASSPSAG